MAALRTTPTHALCTLTCKPQLYANPTEAFEQLTLAVNRLFHRIRRANPGRDVQYFLVWETTARGWPHAHLLLRAPFIAQRWLSRQWFELTGAYIVDIRAVNGAEGAANYIAKYLTKSLNAPWRKKRYRRSRLFFAVTAPTDSPPRLRTTQWRLEALELDTLILHYNRLGYAACREGPDRVVLKPAHLVAIPK